MNKRVNDVRLMENGNIKYINNFEFINLYCHSEEKLQNKNGLSANVCWNFYFESMNIDEETLVEVLLTLRNEYIVCDIFDGRPIIGGSVPDNFTYLMVVQEFKKYFQEVSDKIKERISSKKIRR